MIIAGTHNLLPGCPRDGPGAARLRRHVPDHCCGMHKQHQHHKHHHHKQHLHHQCHHFHHQNHHRHHYHCQHHHHHQHHRHHHHYHHQSLTFVSTTAAPSSVGWKWTGRQTMWRKWCPGFKKIFLYVRSDKTVCMYTFGFFLGELVYLFDYHNFPGTSGRIHRALSRSRPSLCMISWNFLLF